MLCGILQVILGEKNDIGGIINEIQIKPGV